jgi:protein-disulfide isomerase
MHTDTVVNSVRRRLATRCIRSDNQGFVAVLAKVLDHPEHRIGDAVDIREETLCDDRNAHTKIVPSGAVPKVASGDTTRKVLVPKPVNTRVAVRVLCAQGRAVDMRISRALAAVTATLLFATVGCSHQIQGTAKQDPAQPPLALSEDGSGIIAGYPDAPVRIELYTEPQCNHCAALQKEFGDDFERYINLGMLAVTYRPLTFLDQLANEDYSARVANALFLTVPSGKSAEPNGATGPAFQRFVEELWAAQDPIGNGPTDGEMKDMAEKAGIPSDVADQISEGKASDVDIDQMAVYNFQSLVGIDPINSGTPTVYDLGGKKKVDIGQSNWLDELMSSA